jgi:2-oxoglutarate ferredoxin oxidoreductase subunit alpha
MLDLDIGMNERLCQPFEWDDSRTYDRGKVMSYEQLEAGKDFGRYLDVDGDGIPWRTIPGTHPSRGAYFTRGTTRNAYAKYSEAGSDYVYNMERLRKKFDTARSLVPAPIVHRAERPTRNAVIYFGSTAAAMDEAQALLAKQGVHLDAMRLRAFPFPDAVEDFVARHDQVFVVEQNESGQMRSLLINELELDPAKLLKLVHYDGTPITARFIVKSIADALAGDTIVPLRKVMS